MDIKDAPGAQPLADAVSFYRSCDRCFFAHGTEPQDFDREVIGGDGEMTQVMLCKACAELVRD